MSRKKRILIILSSVLLVSIVAYFIFRKTHQKDKHLLCVPKNAAVVLKLDLPQLIDKADPVKLMMSNGFVQNKVLSMLLDAASSGISTDENIYGFMSRENEETFLGLCLSLDDAEKFQAFLKVAGIKVAPDTKDDFSYIAASADLGIGFTNDVAVILYSNNEFIREYCGKYLAQEKGQSILSNNDWLKFSEKDNDVGAWINNTELSGITGDQWWMELIGADKGYGNLSMNFEKGYVKVDYENTPALHFTDLLTSANNYPDESLLDENKTVFFSHVRTSLDGLLESLSKDMSTAAGVAFLETDLGLRQGGLSKILDGEASFAINDYRDLNSYDPRLKEEYADMGELNVEPFYAPLSAFDFRITDEARVKEMLSDFGMERKDSVFNLPGKLLILYAGCANGHLIVTNDFYLADSVAHGKGKSKPLRNSMNTSLYTTLDLERSHLPSELTDPNGRIASNEFSLVPIALAFIKPFEDAAAEVNGNKIIFELQVADKTSNSLNQLLSYYAGLK